MNVAVISLGLFLLAPVAPQAGDKKYEIDVSDTSQEVPKGDQGTFELRIQAKPGFKVSQEAPLKIKLVSTGLGLRKDVLRAKDAKTKKWTSPMFAVPFSAIESGAQNIEVDAVFFVCDERICERKKEKLSVPVSVRP